MALYISLYVIHFIHSSLYLLSPYLYLAPTSPQITASFFSIFVSLFLFCYIRSFVLFFRFHIEVITYSICFPLSALSHNTLQVHPCSCDGKISFFLWLSSIPVCVCVRERERERETSLSIHLLVDTEVASVSWLL